MLLKSLVRKLRYFVWASPLVWLALLNGCGSGSILDPFVPNRIIAFGDAFMDVRSNRFTVNDEAAVAPITYPFAPVFNNLFSLDAANANNTQLTVLERIVSYYGFGTVTPETVGGLPATGAFSYGQGNALIMGADASAAPIGSLAKSVQGQITSFTNSNSFTASDLVIISGGTADVLSNERTGNSAAVVTAAQQLAGLVQTLISKGAKHVVVFGPPNLGKTPYAYNNGKTSTLAQLSWEGHGVTSCSDFNCALINQLQINIGTISKNPVVVIDISGRSSVITGTSPDTYLSAVDPLYNIALAIPGNSAANYEENQTVPVTNDGNYYCNTHHGNATPFIQTGTQCLANTAFDYRTYAYADSINFTPSVNRMIADYIVGQLSIAGWR